MGCESSCCANCGPCCPPGQQVVCLDGQSYSTQSGSCCGSSCSSSCSSSCGSSCTPCCAPTCAPSCAPSQASYNLIYFRPMQYGYNCIPYSTMGCYAPMLSSLGCCVPKNYCC